ncbi:hypothetical protein NEOLEDRAFT_1130281 [Neolentinus lepideus HHB14362 ss-1]|uniref:Uncharacterized protein n=1 Tax=Neolentinus lepideus HHB14362 ss-1 TaxID=1314782 RepID=A0A165U8K6_9AGAM|nr:hypothetical protein NEOLEDRAFT_1130281 [Neolentinus lepideus HHB14362 ss-1]
MASYDIIETSDVEEQELLDAEKPDYWTRLVIEAGHAPSDHSRAGADASRSPLPQQAKVATADQSCHYTPLLKSDAQDCYSPRKRIKLTHDNSLQDDLDVIAQSPRSLTLCDGSSRPVSPDHELDVSPPGSEDSQLQFLSAPAPDISAFSQDTIAADIESDGNIFTNPKLGRWSPPSTSQWSPQYHPQGGVITRVASEEESLESSPFITDYDHGSPDPLYLSTPRRVESPATPHLQNGMCLNFASPLFTPKSQRVFPSSPLTPLSSQTNGAFSSSSPIRSANIPQHASTFSKSGTEVGAVPEDQFHPKYSLRARQAKQLNPYAYDQAYYKKLMRSNPDAIVKVVSPEREKRRHHHHRHDHLSDSGSSRRTRSRSRDRSIRRRTSKPRRSMERERPERERRRSIEKDRQRTTTQDRQSGSVRSERSPKQINAMEKWYPEILQQGLSSGEDESPVLPRPSLSWIKRASGTGSGSEADDCRANSGLPRAATPFFMRSPSARQQTRSPSPKDPSARASSLKKTQVRRRRTRSLLPDSPEPDRQGSDEDVDMDIAPAPTLSRSSSPFARPDTPTVSDHKESGPSSDDELSKQDRKRMKILYRMMPASMIDRAIKKGHRRAKSRSTPRDDENSDEQAVLPGRSRTRLVHDTGRLRAEITGDPESSDTESILKSSDEDEPLPIRPAYSPPPDRWSQSPPPRYRGRSPDRHEPDQSDAVPSPTDDELDEADIDSWLHTTKAAGPRKRLGRHEGDLIDWMLTKTRHVDGSRRGKRRGKHHNGQPSKPHHSTGSRLNIAVAGARKYGEGRQTLLKFGKADRDVPPRQRSSAQLKPYPEEETDMDMNEDSVHQIAETDTSKTAERRRRKRKQAQKPKAYVLSNTGDRITSGRRQTHFITVDLEDAGFCQALAPCDGSQARQQPTSKHKAVPRVHGTSDAPVIIESDDEENFIPPAIPGHAPDPPELVLRNIKSDCNVPFLPSGITFGPRTYIGRGWLHELTRVLSSEHETSRPMAYTAYDFDLSPSMTLDEFMKILPKICDLCFLRATTPPIEDGAEEQRVRWEVLVHVTCQLLSWLFKETVATDQEASSLSHAQEEVARLATRLEECSAATGDCLNEPGFWVAYWFCIEASARLAVSSRKSDLTWFMRYGALLVELLRRYGMQQTIDPLISLDKPLDDSSVSVRTAEVWVSLFHVCDTAATLAIRGPPMPRPHPLSCMVMDAIQRDKQVVHSHLESSENTWKTIFIISALSQFSVHGMVTSTPRLPAAWELVEYVLKRIRLTAESDSAQGLSKRSLSKRDGYIRLVVSRCFMLWKRWHWRLDNALPIFNHLVEIFKSRKFTNLLDERSDFPNFLRRANLQLLSECSSGDTAFTIFLKLIVQTVHDFRVYSEQIGKDTSVPKLKKLLSLAIPVGSVPFTKATPPMGQELSMLYNRYSAIAIAVYLDPTTANIRYRLSHAQRYVVFKDADFTTRMACIRGVMHLAMLIRHLQVPMDAVNEWLAEITNVLVDECTEMATAERLGESRNRILLLIQLLLGSVRRVIETPNMDPSRTAVYPDPGLLEGPWVTRVFAASTNLANVPTTGIEIRKLVQAFLDARAAVMPKPRIHRAAPANSVVSEEDSQGQYDDMQIDLDDPELLAALGEDVQSAAQKEIRAKDENVCKAMDQYISPAIYRLVCRNINESTLERPTEEHWADIDKWIDCWVGCANVTVYNGRRDWSHYLALGPQSWERIIDAFCRRRVGLRFMYMVLQSDPSAYSMYQDRFLEVFFESMITPKATIENRYAALVLMVDGLRHLLLRGTPWDMSSDNELPISEFMSGRLLFLAAVFTNLSRALHDQNDFQSRGQTQSSMELIVSMFAAMQSIYQHMGKNVEHQRTYGDFCSSVLELLAEHATLKRHPRLAPFIEWVNKTDFTH